MRYTVTVTPDLFHLMLWWLGESFEPNYTHSPKRTRILPRTAPDTVAGYLVAPNAFGTSRTVTEHAEVPANA